MRGRRRQGKERKRENREGEKNRMKREGKNNFSFGIQATYLSIVVSSIYVHL